MLPLDIEHLKSEWSRLYKPATVKNILEVLRRVINWGINKNLIPPLTFKIKVPKVNNEKTEDLTQEQQEKLLRVIDKNPENMAGAIMKLILLSGMRKSEIFRLKWTDVDFERAFIFIREPKGGQDQRIPLNQEARLLLRAQPRISQYVFPGKAGRERKDIRKLLWKIRKPAELPEGFRCFHGLRHVYASNLVSSGRVDLFTLSKLLTHKDPTMTRRYAHLRDQALKDASNLAGELISQATNEKPEGEGEK